LFFFHHVRAVAATTPWLDVSGRGVLARTDIADPRLLHQLEARQALTAWPLAARANDVPVIEGL